MMISMRGVFTLSLSLLLVFFVKCTTDIVSGGSSSEVVACVHGQIFTKDSTAVSGVIVTIIPSDYNATPTTSTANIVHGTTDAMGFFQFDSIKKGVYNLYAEHPDNSTRMLSVGITLESDTEKVSANYLKQPSSVTIGLPEVIDTVNDYIYVQGLDLTWAVKAITKMSDGSRTITIDSLPAGELPAIKYYSRQSGTATTLAASVTTKENDTVSVGIDSQLKPVWTLPTIVGITDSTVSYFGGLDSIKILLNQFFKAINAKFNTPNVFSGVLDFTIDSIYTFNTPCSLEIHKALPARFSQRLIMNGFVPNDVGEWVESSRTAYASEPRAADLFGDFSISAIAWEFALGRGCIPSGDMVVAPEKDPVSNSGFAGEQNFMYSPYTESTWDTYNIHAVNYYSSKLVTPQTPIMIGYPQSIDIITQSLSGASLSNVSISCYGVKWSTFSVTDTLLTFNTDSTGTYTFSSNPYIIDNTGLSTYCNILIRAISSSDTVYAWMPINEVGIAYMENPSGPYKKVIQLNK